MIFLGNLAFLGKNGCMSITQDPIYWFWGILGYFLIVSSGFCVEGAKYSVVEKDLILDASVVARTDGVGARWCGRGTLSVLASLGLADGLRGADGHDWEEALWEAGWRPVPCYDPLQAPYGSVLVYDSDWRKIGRNKRDTPGGRWGHVEFVAWDAESGSRVYVSDAPRKTPGGTVLDNFTHRAWVPPSFVELFRRLQKRDLPPAGYVYRGRKTDGPGTHYEKSDTLEFKDPQEYVLFLGRRGFLGGVGGSQLEEEGLGRGDGLDEDSLPLGPVSTGPNPLFGGVIPYKRGYYPILPSEDYSDAVGDCGTEDLGSNSSKSSLRERGLWAAPIVVEDPVVVRERLDLLLAIRKREASQFLGGVR